MKITHQSDYSERRRREYPDVREQLDALWKIFDRLDKRAEIDIGEDGREMLSRVIGVKTKYPKARSDKP